MEPRIPSDGAEFPQYGIGAAFQKGAAQQYASRQPMARLISTLETGMYWSVNGTEMPQLFLISTYSSQDVQAAPARGRHLAHKGINSNYEANGLLAAERPPCGFESR